MAVSRPYTVTDKRALTDNEWKIQLQKNIKELRASVKEGILPPHNVRSLLIAVPSFHILSTLTSLAHDERFFIHKRVLSEKFLIGPLSNHGTS